MNRFRTQMDSSGSGVSGMRTRTESSARKTTGRCFWHGFCLCNSVMKNIVHKTTSEKGSIMLEYVIVMCGLGAAAVVFMNRAFYDVQTGFGPLGQQIVAFYQRTLGGLSLPVP